MIQDLITYGIVIWAFWQVIKFFFQFFKSGKADMTCSCCTNKDCKIRSDLFNTISDDKYSSLKPYKDK